MSPGDSLHEGYVVSDRFELLRVIGRGGMGSVWVARHLSLKIEVAIKFIDGPLANRQDLRSRFAQEARTAARIQSPHVVNILDYGFDGTRPYIVMELLQGEPLGARLAREKRLPPTEVATILAQAAKGLSRAHALGIVHRDLKPDNLFLCRDEDGVHVKILDFGIARDDTPFGAASHRTGTGQLLGTPAYMSPEQAVAKTQIDFRSDLYSLATVAYHALVGRLPFDTDALGELVVSLATTVPPPPSSYAPELTPGIDAWFKVAFQKDPAARFSSAKEMADTFSIACRASSAAFDKTLPVERQLAPADLRGGQRHREAHDADSGPSQRGNCGISRRCTFLRTLVGVVGVGAGAPARRTRSMGSTRRRTRKSRARRSAACRRSPWLSPGSSSSLLRRPAGVLRDAVACDRGGPRARRLGDGGDRARPTGPFG